MADRTGATSPTPPQLRIRVIATPEAAELTVHRLRQSFAEVEASEPRPSRDYPGHVRLYVQAVL